jgi:hypothetical protein
MIKKCNTCNVELTDNNWQPAWKLIDRTQCKECSKKNNKASNPSNNPKRMFVDGKYIKQTHPLYKAGNYKSFGDAAFESLENYKESKEGEVYVITNPAWKGWVKIGMAVDSRDRCLSYQTSSPFRDYKLEVAVSVDDRRLIESMAHERASWVAEEEKCEWFKMPVDTAVEIARSLKNEVSS